MIGYAIFGDVSMYFKCFVRPLLVILWLKKVAISSKEKYNGGVELVVDHYSVSLLLVRESISMPSSFPGGKCRNAFSLQSGHVFFVGNHCPCMQFS